VRAFAIPPRDQMGETQRKQTEEASR
jgi:hypothetical protein